MSKIHPKGIVPKAPGPTITKNDPAKFDQNGKFKGKTPSNGVVGQGSGPTFTENSTHISSPNADKPAKVSKVQSSGKGESPFHPECAKNASDVGSSAGQPTSYLKRSYEK